jgi:hypothetical protein
MLTPARHLRDFPEQLSAGGRLSSAAQACDRLLARVLEALHDRQIRQAEREIHRYRHLVRTHSN